MWLWWPEMAAVAASAVAVSATMASAATPPVAVAGVLCGEQQRVGGALVAWPTTVFVRLCAFGIMVVPLVTIVRWLLGSTMMVMLVAPTVFTAR